MKRATVVAGPLVVEPAGVGRFVVRSDHSEYVVKIAPPACGCAGFRYRGRCRHVVAAQAFAEASGATPEAAAAGELLASMEKAKGAAGGRGNRQLPRYEEVGVEKMQAHRWQTMAKATEAQVRTLAARPGLERDVPPPVGVL